MVVDTSSVALVVGNTSWVDHRELASSVVVEDKELVLKDVERI